MDAIKRTNDFVNSLLKQYGQTAIKVFLGALIIALHLFLGLAIAHNFKTAVALLCFMSVGWLATIYYLLLYPALVHFSPHIQACWDPIIKLWKRRIIKGIVYFALFAAFVAFLLIVTNGSWIRKVSIGGLLFYIVFSVLISNNPARIKWRPVIWGVLLQFGAGLLVLRWQPGRDAFNFTSEQLVRFLDYTTNGTYFVFGFVANPPIICGMDAPFSFSSLPIIIYFGAITSVLFYYGVIQFILLKVAWLMQYTMGTTAAETLNAAACIFIGPTEAAVLMRFALPLMTSSELMAALTCGFSSISGSLFASYIAFGACGSHLLASNVMSAPALLAVSKIMHPETEKSKQKDLDNFQLPRGSETSALECLSNGAVQAVWFIFAIIASLIVFLALLALLDSIIGTLGEMIGYHDVTFNVLVGYLFFPLAYVMGVSDATDADRKFTETLKVAQLMGTKTVLNEFIAYQQMSGMIIGGEIGPRAQMMATYALCGYSNFSQIASQLAMYGSMCSQKKAVYAKVALKSMIAGNIACFMTACIAGILVQVPDHCAPANSADYCVDLS